METRFKPLALAAIAFAFVCSLPTLFLVTRGAFNARQIFDFLIALGIAVAVLVIRPLGPISLFGTRGLIATLSVAASAILKLVAYGVGDTSPIGVLSIGGIWAIIGFIAWSTTIAVLKVLGGERAIRPD